MSAPILQTHLREAPWMEARRRRLPGVVPLAEAGWLRVDEAYGGQMARREALLKDFPEKVMRLLPEALEAAGELHEMILSDLAARDGFAVGPEAVSCPDGRVVARGGDPLVEIGRLVQEDFCILQKRGGEHVLEGAILCFPASWTLSEKIARPLVRIHEPVESYDSDIARRVQRLFDGVRVDHALTRTNALFYDDPELFQPRREGENRAAREGPAPYLRSERQCVLRLPGTGAVVFSIHTTVIARESLSAAQLAGLAEHHVERVS